MAHLESYNSFKTKRSKDKKARAKETALNKKVDDDFVVERNRYLKTATIIETTYKEAKVLYGGGNSNRFRHATKYTL